MNSQKNLSSRSKYVYAFLINLTKSLIFFTKHAYTFLKNLPSKTKFVISLVLVFMFSSASFLLIINAVDNSLNGFGSSYVNFSMPSFTSTNDIFAEFKPKVNISFSYHGDDAVTCNTYKIRFQNF